MISLFLSCEERTIQLSSLTPFITRDKPLKGIPLNRFDDTLTTKQTRDVDLKLGQCWASVGDIDPASDPRNVLSPMHLLAKIM